MPFAKASSALGDDRLSVAAAIEDHSHLIGSLQQAGLVTGPPRPPSSLGASKSTNPFRWFPTRKRVVSSEQIHQERSATPSPAIPFPANPPSPSMPSLASNFPMSSQPSNPAASSSHPYASNDLLTQSTMVSDKDEDDNCPVCLESLSLRLRGEKPHVVPICGHKLHEACFEAVYGSVARARHRPGSLGLCGVCRRDMKIGDPAEHGRNKFAALSGLTGGRNTSSLDTHKVRSITKRTLPSDTTGGKATHDPNEDDAPVSSQTLGAGHASHNSGDTVMGFANNRTMSSKMTNRIPLTASSGSSVYSASQMEYVAPTPHVVVLPQISVRAEHSSVSRNADREKKTNITCMITIEMPSRLDSVTKRRLSGQTNNGVSLPKLSPAGLAAAAAAADADMQQNHDYRPEPQGEPSDGLADTEYHVSSANTSSDGHADPFEHIVRDLTDRMADWKGHSPKDFGKLHMYDLLHVRKDKKIREFYIYLFAEAVLCVSDDARKSAERLDLAEPQNRLRLKGRVFIRHIGKVDDTSEPASEHSDGENSLTISMQDEDTPEVFVILFKTSGQLQNWKARIEALVNNRTSLKQKQSLGSIRDSTYSGETSQSGPSSATAASTYSKYSRTTISSGGAGFAKEMATLQEEPSDQAYLNELRSAYPRLSNPAAESMLTLKADRALPALNLPHEFPPVDLVLIFSVPTPTNVPSSYQLKLRLIKSTLDFVVNNIGPRGRVAIVTYCCGEGGRGTLRKTPLLAVARGESKGRLAEFIDSIGNEGASEFEPFSALDQRDDRVSVVTAVNLALDVVLQRKAKSALTGMVLMNDGPDGSHKQQMDLAMARAEAASVPIHTFGWGKGHDPSSLWLLSNHTGGSYTFVKDPYGLREAVAGCIGGILSVAANAVKLFVSVQEPRFFRIRKVAGISNAIVGSEGREVDITLGELRSGERREILIEVEMGASSSKRSAAPEIHGYSSATDDFLRKNGLNPLSLQDDSSDFYEDEYYTMIDDVPLFEVNASFRDPIAGKHFSRLPTPALLMVSIAPPPDPSKPISANSDSAVVRRRVELLCSDMQTRCLLLMSRRNPQQAQRLLTETRRIIGTILANLSSIAAESRNPSVQSEKLLAATTLSACMEDIDLLLEGVEQREQFDNLHRNHAAQSAVVLRDQRAWAGRSTTERLFWRADFSLWMSHRSSQYLAMT